MGFTTEDTKLSAWSPHSATPNLCFLLFHAAHVLKTRLTAGLEELEISPRAHHVLRAASQEPRTQIELARVTSLDKTTMVVTVDELEADGLARRRPSPTDRRARVIEVTDAGETLLQRADAIVERIHGEVLDELPEADRGPFVEALTTLVGGALAEPEVCSQPVRRPR